MVNVANHCLFGSSALTREEVADGFQIAGFVSTGLRNLHSEKACVLVECSAENISFHIDNKSKFLVLLNII